MRKIWPFVLSGIVLTVAGAVLANIGPIYGFPRAFGYFFECGGCHRLDFPHLAASKKSARHHRLPGFWVCELILGALSRPFEVIYMMGLGCLAASSVALLLIPFFPRTAASTSTLGDSRHPDELSC